MPRQPRLDFPGAVHHVFVRGNARSAIAVDDVDHQRALDLLERAASRFELVCHAWCFLPNHAHLLVTSQLGNLSRAMHWLGTCSAHSFNRRHERSGHLFQGRFGSKLVGGRCVLRSSLRAICRSTRCGRDCVARRRIGFGRVTRRQRACGRRRGSLIPRDSSELLGSVDAYVAWVARGVDATILDERGFRQPAPRPLAREPPRGRLGRRDHVRAFPRLQPGRDRTAPRREPVADQSPPRCIFGVRHAYCVPDPECASTLARRRGTQHEARQARRLS